jgi:pyruvate decarboxylase
VYLALPTDMVYQQISSERLKIPLSPALLSHHPKTENFVIDLIHERVTAAGGDVIVLVDACVVRHGVRKEVVDFLRETGFPVYATPMGKTAIDENDKRYGGVQIIPQSKLRIYSLTFKIYIGSLTRPHVKDKVENAALIISIGGLASDLNTGEFSYNIPTEKLVEVRFQNTVSNPASVILLYH